MPSQIKVRHWRQHGPLLGIPKTPLKHCWLFGGMLWCVLIQIQMCVYTKARMIMPAHNSVQTRNSCSRCFSLAGISHFAHHNLTSLSFRNKYKLCCEQLARQVTVTLWPYNYNKLQSFFLEYRHRTGIPILDGCLSLGHFRNWHLNTKERFERKHWYQPTFLDYSQMPSRNGMPFMRWHKHTRFQAHFHICVWYMAEGLAGLAGYNGAINVIDDKASIVIIDTKVGE